MRPSSDARFLSFLHKLDERGTIFFLFMPLPKYPTFNLCEWQMFADGVCTPSAAKCQTVPNLNIFYCMAFLLIFQIHWHIFLWGDFLCSRPSPREREKDNVRPAVYRQLHGAVTVALGGICLPYQFRCELFRFIANEIHCITNEIYVFIYYILLSMSRSGDRRPIVAIVVVVVHCGVHSYSTQAEGNQIINHIKFSLQCNAFDFFILLPIRV